MANASAIADALSASVLGELLILDVHGDTDQEQARLDPLPGRPFFNLRQVASDS